MAVRRALAYAVAASVLLAASANANDEYVDFTLPGGAVITCEVLTPAGYEAGRAYPTLLAFPPGAQDLEMVDAGLAWWEYEALRRGYVVISPAAPRGVSFRSGSRDLIDPLVQMLVAKYPVAGGKLDLAGVSNGGVSAFAAALDHPERFRSLTVLAGAPPSATELANIGRLDGIAVNMFIGEFDPGFRESMEQTRDAFTAHGHAIHYEVVRNSGHSIFVLQGPGAARVFDRMQ